MGTSYKRDLFVPAVTGVVVLAVLAVFFGIAAWPSKADGGHVIVIRNGGLFDDNSYQRTIQPNSSLTWTGLWSQEHEYPASQRNWVVSAAESADSNEVINVPTKDGVNVGIEGTFYFTLNYTDAAVMADFDNRFGTRSYGGKMAYDGDEGWTAFLEFTMGKLVQNVLREQIGLVQCEQLIASCALVQNGGALSPVPTGEDAGNSALTKIQDAVNLAFVSDVKSQLGNEIFTGIQFTLSKVTLPQNIQDAINGYQAANVAVQQAQAEATANQKRQEGYNACPTCALIDQTRAIPPSITVWAPGATSAVPVR